MPTDEATSATGAIRARRGTAWVAVWAICLLAAAVFFWTGFSFFRTEFPDVSVLRRQFPVVTYPDKGEPKVRFQSSRPPGWAALTEVSRPAVGAVVVSEDWAFYQHKGFDPNQIEDAVRDSWRSHALVRGASTITQQVVKNVFLSTEKSLWRKLKELLLAVELEEEVGKRRILETYLNIAEWGHGIVGIRSAASHYFGKSPSELTAKEGAFLAMLLPSPKRYSASFRAKKLTQYARETIESILTKMVQARYIEKELLQQEVETPLSFEAVEPVEESTRPEEVDPEGTI